MEDRKKHCPHCGTALPENASFCPHCESVLIEKHPAAVPKPKRRRRITVAILLAAVMAAALTAVGFASRGKVIDAQGAELTYETGGQTFHLELSFESQGGAPFFSQPEIVENAREDQLHGRTATSLLFVDDGGKENRKEDFLALVDHCEVTAVPREGGELLQIDETFLPEQSNAAFEAAPSYHAGQAKEGTADIIWTIYLKNGDTLRLRHTVKITRIPVVTLTENDYPMATVEELNTLLEMLAREADQNTIYILSLPSVTYEGGLTMKNFCCDLVGSEGGTTFTGTVTIATRGIHPSNITNVRFVGDGTGIGLSASEGAFLHRCTFENWEIGAYGGLGSWVNATGCTFRGNDVGLWLDNRGGATCSGSYYGDSVYEDNGTAVRIAAMPGAETLDFSNCVFRGNEVNVENTAGYAVDLSQIVTADN